MIHHVYSDNRDSLTEDTPNNFQYTLNIPLNHNRISLVSFNIPKSYYLIIDGENTFTLTSGAVDTTYTVPVGNYDVNTFQTAVNALITPSSIAFVRRLGKYVLTSAADSFSCGFERLAGCFGFEVSTTYPFSGGSLTSARIVNFQALTQVYICCDIAYSDTSSSLGNVLHNIYVNQSMDFVNIAFQNSQIHETSRPIVYNSDGREESEQVIPYPVRFKLLDQNHNLIDTNSLPIEMVIKTYRQDNIDKLIRDYVRFLMAKEKRDMESRQNSKP